MTPKKDNCDNCLSRKEFDVYAEGSYKFRDKTETELTNIREETRSEIRLLREDVLRLKITVEKLPEEVLAKIKEMMYTDNGNFFKTNAMKLLSLGVLWIIPMLITIYLAVR